MPISAVRNKLYPLESRISKREESREETCSKERMRSKRESIRKRALMQNKWVNSY